MHLAIAADDYHPIECRDRRERRQHVPHHRQGELDAFAKA
jgi:hypothetical protein